MAIQSDEFNGIELSGVWSIINPRNDVVVTVSGGLLRIDVPGLIQHNTWGYAFAPRVAQVHDNSDFEIELKFNSIPAVQFQHEGAMIEQDGNNYAKFEFSYGGLTLHASAVIVVNGIPTLKSDVVISGSPAVLYMRVKRVGIQYTHRYSIDGSTWTDGATFNQSLNTTKIGIFAGNAYEPTTRMVAIVDYFRNLDNYIPPLPCVSPQFSFKTGQV